MHLQTKMPTIIQKKTKKIYHKLENRSYVVQNSQKSDLGMEKEF